MLRSNAKNPVCRAEYRSFCWAQPEGAAAGKPHVGKKPLLPTPSKSKERRERAATGFKKPSL